MQIVIDIPKEFIKVLNDIKDESFINLEIYKVISNGTVLPEGHGRLGDLDKIKKKMQYYHDDCAKTSEYTRLGFETAIAVVENAKPIIEADKLEREDKNKENE